MPKKFLQSWLPSPQKMAQMRLIQMMGKYALNPKIWYINRHAVSKAVLIGTFWGLLPIPFHSLFIIVFVIVFNANLPIGLILSWLSNPLTMIPIIWSGFWIGSHIYQVHMINKKMLLGVLHQIEHWVTSFGHAHVDLSLAKILLTGLVVESAVAAIVAYIITLLFWRLHVIHRWKTRHRHLPKRPQP